MAKREAVTNVLATQVARGLVGDTGALEVRPLAAFYPGIGLQ
jgi:hypothetical protein